MSDKTVDLRSDTITLPTEEMQEAMARAPLGEMILADDSEGGRPDRLAVGLHGVEQAGCFYGVYPVVRNQIRQRCPMQFGGVEHSLLFGATAEATKF